MSTCTWLKKRNIIHGVDISLAKELVVVPVVVPECSLTADHPEVG